MYFANGSALSFITDTAVISADAVTGLLAGNSLEESGKTRKRFGGRYCNGREDQDAFDEIGASRAWVSLKRAGPSLNE